MAITYLLHHLYPFHLRYSGNLQESSADYNLFPSHLKYTQIILEIFCRNISPSSAATLWQVQNVPGLPSMLSLFMYACTLQITYRKSETMCSYYKRVRNNVFIL